MDALMAVSTTVVLRQEEINLMLRSVPIAEDLRKHGETTADNARSRAPIGDKPSHGNPVGNLRDHIHVEVGEDIDGTFVDVVTDATADGFPYGKVQNLRRPYLDADDIR